jgi:hypothetical protein
MTMPNNKSRLLEVALRYATERHLEVFPANPATKAPLTTNGMKDATTNLTQIEQWWTQHPNALIACRIPPDQIVLDIDPRHGGHTTWAELERCYAAILSQRIHESGRNDGGAHHWFIRPAGRLSARNLHEWAKRNNVGHPIVDNDGNHTGKWTSGIDILHHDHRYSILPPSPHPETGRPYAWSRKDEPGEMPAFLADLITLNDTPKPTTTPTPTITADDNSPADWYSNTHTWRQILEPHGWTCVNGDGDEDGSKWRHPNATANSSASVRNGCLFVYTPNTHFDETEPGDPKGITKFRAWAILEHAGDLSEAARHAKTLRGDTNRPTFDLTGFQTANNTQTARNHLNLPVEFWDARPSLQHIRQAAHSRTRSADAVLAATLARISAQIPPEITLPAIVGGRASLNLLIGIIATSGGGKSTSNDVARELAPIDRNDVISDVPPGSGEGITELFFEMINEEQADGKMRKVKRQTKRGALIYLDEGQALAEMGNRKGATLLPTLRSAWSGAVIGQSNATVETHRVLKAHTYRLSIIIGFQLEYAAPLIADAAGGTPQRFIFASAIDPNLPDQPPEWPGPINIELPPITPTGHDIDFDPTIRTEIHTNAKAITKGEHTPDPLDSHADLVRMKAAALLAVLDNRWNVTGDDWHLAGHIMRTSNSVRTWIIEHNHVAERKKEEAFARRLATRELVATDLASDHAIIRGARAIGRAVHRSDTPLTANQVRQALNSTLRKLASFDDMIAVCIEQGWVMQAVDKYEKGPSKPS